MTRYFAVFSPDLVVAGTLLWQLSMFAIVLFVGVACSGTVLETGPVVSVGMTEIGIKVATDGTVKLESEFHVPLAGTKYLGLDWAFGFEQVLATAELEPFQLNIITMGTDGAYSNRSFDIGKPFEVLFSRCDWVQRIAYEDNGSIVAVVQPQPCPSAVPTQTPSLRSRTFSSSQPAVDAPTHLPVTLNVRFNRAYPYDRTRCAVEFTLHAEGGDGTYDYYHDTRRPNADRLVTAGNRTGSIPYTVYKPRDIEGDPFSILVCSADECAHTDVWIQRAYTQCD